MKVKKAASIPKDNSIDDEVLPEGWTLTKLDFAGQWLTGGTPSRSKPEFFNGTIPWVKITDLNDGIVYSTEDKISELGLQNSAAKLLPVGTICVGIYGSIGKIGILGTQAATNQACGNCIVDETKVNPKFLYYYIISQRRNLLSHGRGGTQANINNKILRDWPLPLPPLSEQQRIVARVEALLTHVNTVREKLIQESLIMKRFRQAVLAAACSARLTEGWREKNPYIEPAAVLLENIFVRRENKKRDHLKKVQPLNDELDDLPDNWIWTQIGFITESMKNGVYKEPKYYNEDGFPCLRMYNIEDGNIIWKNIKHMDLTDNEIETYRLKQNDILINRVNSRELVGKSALITEKIEPCVFESKNIRLRMYSSEINSQYVVYWLQVNAQKFFNLNAQQTVGMASINQDQIASMPIPLPPLVEQHEIVHRVMTLFERADAFDREVTFASQRCERLTQAVLRRAFRGELVERDTDIWGSTKKG